MSATEGKDNPRRQRGAGSRGGARRRGREYALTLLFQTDISGQGPSGAFISADEVLDILVEQWEMSREEEVRMRPEIESFGRKLCESFFREAEVIDRIIDELSHEWALERMPTIDRNILRMALAELRNSKDVPISAAINEAVELAKIYGTPDSGKFINGILGAFARRHGLVAEKT